MKALSAANQLNIALKIHSPIVLVKMAGISKQWSSEDKDGYEARIHALSALTMEIDPLDGLGRYGDFTVDLVQETPTQFIQDQSVDHETVALSVQYGTDAEIGLVTGKLDRWEFRQGIIRLHCLANQQLAEKKLPIQQITATNFSTYLIPEENVGRWVPVTIGTPYRPLGYLIDWTRAANRVKYNAVITGHDGISAFRTLYLWISAAKKYVEVVTIFTAHADGYLRNTSITNPILEGTLTLIPVDDFWYTFDYGAAAAAYDENTTTYAAATAVSGDGQTNVEYLRLGLGEQPYPEGFIIREDELYVQCKIEKQNALNWGGRTQEVFSALLERNINPPGGTAVALLANGETAFNNIDGAGSPTGKVLDTSEYAKRWGRDVDETNTNEPAFPVNRLTNRYLVFRMIEEDPAGGGDTAEYFRVYEARLRVDFDAPTLKQQYHADLDGYEDDGSGTYTGTANAIIQNPAAAIYFTLAKLLNVTGFNTSAIATARTALNTYRLAGQVLDLTPAEDVVDALAKQGKLTVFPDYQDQWTMTAFTLPTGLTADKTFSQDEGDFVADTEVEGEIVRVTQSSLSDLYNQFEILYQWNEGARKFDASLVFDETTPGPIGGWCTESQDRYNLTRKLTIEATWIADEQTARSYGVYLIYRHADRKRIVTWQASWNALDVELSDRCKLNHVDIQHIEDTTVYAGYRVGTPLATITAGYTDPDTGATIKAGAKIRHYEGRHQYAVTEITMNDPLAGVIQLTGRQVDISRAALSDPRAA